MYTENHFIQKQRIIVFFNASKNIQRPRFSLKIWQL